MNGQFKLGAIDPLRYFSAIAVLLGVLFGFVTPVADDQSRLWNVVQWLLQTSIPMVFLVLSSIWAHKNSRFDALSPWLKLALMGVLGATLYAPFAYSIDLMLDAEEAPFSVFGLINEWLAVTPPVTLCWIAINAPWLMGFQLQRGNGAVNMLAKPHIEKSVEIEQEAPQDACLSEGLWPLLSASLGKDIVYFKAELHYLLVVTTLDSELILYNLKDAVKALPANAGAQCHRSYWVAFDSIASFSKSGRQGQLLLKNGEKIPVSRANVDSFLSFSSKLSS